MISLDDEYFNKFSSLIYSSFGINFKESKRSVLESKIIRLMNKRGIDEIENYYKELRNGNKDEMRELINTVTTNTTHFFREPSHFQFLRNNIDLITEMNSTIGNKRELRVWCAAASTGQEPYTLAMTLHELLGEHYDIKILATDINTEVLQYAMKGIYSDAEVENVPKYYLEKYFTKDKDENYKITSNISNIVTYRQYNLLSGMKFKSKFDLVFCRNVMIYFDSKTIEDLLAQFSNSISDGGILVIGHAESLMSKEHNFEFFEPSIYFKPTYGRRNHYE